MPRGASEKEGAGICANLRNLWTIRAGNGAGIEIRRGVGHIRPAWNWIPAGLAQLAEHLICNQKVIGSNPIAGSNHSQRKRS